MAGSVSAFVLAVCGWVVFVAGFCLGLVVNRWVIALASHAIVRGVAVQQEAVKALPKVKPFYNGDEKAADFEEEIAPRRPREFYPNR